MTVLEKRILQRVRSVTNVDPFKNTRRREYVEARALLMYLYYNVCRLNLSQIARLFQEQGKGCHHATVLHSLRNFEMYKKFNPRFNEMVTDVLSQGSWGTHAEKIEYIKQRLFDIPKEVVEDVYDIISNEYRV
tara:strand:+ start:364 stop:762 length:399 start_codon:yes stop_codon:yes gene_type:complete